MNANMNRRDFLGKMAGIAGASALGGCAGFLGSGRKMLLGCQLWGVKEIWEKNGDITSVFPQLAAMGYDGVQSMAFWKSDPDRLEQALQANGLRLADMPIAFSNVDTDAELAKTVAFCRRFEVDFLYIPWMKPPTIDGWREFARRLDDCGRRLAPYGIRIGYHHHLHEFAEAIGGVYPADALIEHPTFNFELDVGPVLEAGRVPAEVMRKLDGRVPGLHAKPYPGTYAGAPDDRQDWPAIVATAREIGVKWFVVECERRKDTFDDVRASADYFRRLGV